MRYRENTYNGVDGCRVSAEGAYITQGDVGVVGEGERVTRGVGVAEGGIGVRERKGHCVDEGVPFVRSARYPIRLPACPP